MNQIESLIFLLGAAALLAQLARVLNVPYPILLVVGGLGLGFVPGLPVVQIAPEVIFIIFLPPLLNAAAFTSSPLDLRVHLRPIVLLAIGLVLLTTLVVAAVVHFVVGLPWAVSFVLGAILAPTDLVAAEAIFRRLGVSERVGTIAHREPTAPLAKRKATLIVEKPRPVRSVASIATLAIGPHSCSSMSMPWHCVSMRLACGWLLVPVSPPNRQVA